MSSRSIAVLIMVSSLTVAARPTSAQPRTLAGTVYATFERRGDNSELIGLAAGDLLPGTVVTVMCTGRTCPFASKSLNVRSKVSVFAMTDLFVDPVFPAGTVLEVRITRPGSIGKVFIYELRSSAEPSIKTLCLPPGDSKPVSC